MTLIKSISGIRGTIGGKPGDSLTPVDIVKFTAAFGTFIQSKNKTDKTKIIVGRDARMSGSMLNSIVAGTLCGLGIDVVDLGFSTTPTVEMAVVFHKAQGGIILTASHNPKQWNALKLLNADGEFISASEGEEVLRIAESDEVKYCDVNHLGKVTTDNTALAKHFEAILALPLVDRKAIEKANFKIETLSSYTYDDWEQIRLPKAVRKLNLDFLHCTCNTAPINCSVPLLLTLHDIIYLEKVNIIL